MQRRCADVHPHRHYWQQSSPRHMCPRPKPIFKQQQESSRGKSCHRLAKCGSAHLPAPVPHDCTSPPLINPTHPPDSTSRLPRCTGCPQHPSANHPLFAHSPHAERCDHLASMRPMSIIIAALSASTFSSPTIIHLPPAFQSITYRDLSMHRIA